jgi:hypothetical protein
VLAKFEMASRVYIPKLEFSQKSTEDPLYQYLQSKGCLADSAYSETRRKVLLFLEEAMADVFGQEVLFLSSPTSVLSCY